MLTITTRRLQMNLKFLTLYKGAIDGIYGSETREAVREYQRTRPGLAIDGIAGSKTKAAIKNEIKEIQRYLNVRADGVAGSITTKAYEDEWKEIIFFKPSEFKCKCGCGETYMDLRVVKEADRIRGYFGSPVIVNSGIRCNRHNVEVGGVPRSRHKRGKAIDLWVKGVSGDRLVQYTNRLVQAGNLRFTYKIGRTNAVHIDVE